MLVSISASIDKRSCHRIVAKSSATAYASFCSCWQLRTTVQLSDTLWKATSLAAVRKLPTSRRCSSAASTMSAPTMLMQQPNAMRKMDQKPFVSIKPRARRPSTSRTVRVHLG